MRKKIAMAVSAGVLALAQSLRAEMPILQIEAPGSGGDYAAIDYAGSNTVTVTSTSSPFVGITFHVIAGNSNTNTYSGHANTVGQNAYGTGAVSHSFVQNVYSDNADRWLGTPNGGPSLNVQ